MVHALWGILKPMCFVIIFVTYETTLVSDVNLKTYMVVLCICWFFIVTVRIFNYYYYLIALIFCSNSN